MIRAYHCSLRLRLYQGNWYNDIYNAFRVIVWGIRLDRLNQNNNEQSNAESDYGLYLLLFLLLTLLLSWGLRLQL